MEPFPCKRQLCESKCGRGSSTPFLPPSFFIPSSASSLLQSKRQVDPYEPSVIDAAPHTSQSGPWRSTAYAAAAVGNKADMGVMTWDKGQVMVSFQSGDHKKRSGLS